MMTDTVTDSLGRVLEVAEPSAMERMGLMRACGKASDIDRWFGPVMLCACVRSIDGAPQPKVASAENADAMVARVGDAGIEAAAEWISKRREQPLDKDAAKN